MAFSRNGNGSAGGFKIQLNSDESENDSAIEYFNDVTDKQIVYDIIKPVIDIVLRIFIGANLFVFIGIAICFYFDNVNLSAYGPGQYSPIITSEVIIALIGATTVQISAIIISIMSRITKNLLMKKQ